MSVVWWLNLMGIVLSGTGATILTYDVFSFRSKYGLDTWAGDIARAEHETKNQMKIKIAMILIPLGAASQLLSILFAAT